MAGKNEILEATAPDNLLLLPEPFVVQNLITETDDTFTIEITPRGERRNLGFLPGQFNMLYVFGIGEVPISISGDPMNTKVWMHTTREVGVVTRAIKRLKKGEVIGVRGPYGTSWPVRESEGNDIVIVSGGIGLAPLRPALYTLLSNRDRYGRIVLLYGARTPADILYKKELERWRARFDLEVYATVDRAMSGWHGNVGVVTTLIPRAPFDPMSTIAMVCGPEIMMRYTIQELQKRGLPDHSIYLSMERNMKCGVGFCGHCQMGGKFVCKDGPVFRYDTIKNWLFRWEV
ncbi:MAG: FAD/NAD(P)-binding protein [Verrucomicrobiia bacterium]